MLFVYIEMDNNIENRNVSKFQQVEKLVMQNNFWQCRSYHLINYMTTKHNTKPKQKEKQKQSNTRKRELT